MNPALHRILLHYKPSVPKYALFFIASGVWAFAGSLLLIKGIPPIVHSSLPVLQLIGACLSGILFYLLMFSRISAKHIFRIGTIQVYYPCAFSFFDWKSYGLMAVMISSGIAMKKFNLIPLNYYSLFLVCMGIPLLISALRFFRAGMSNRSQPANYD